MHKKQRLSYCKHHIFNQRQILSFLCEDHAIEVYMGDIENTDSIYEMIVHKIDEESRTVDVFFWDDPEQKIYTVSFTQVAPVRSCMKNAVFQTGQIVEARYRIDDSSPWGWWIGKITEIIYEPNTTNVTHYMIEFEGHPKEIISFEKHLIRRQSFF